MSEIDPLLQQFFAGSLSRRAFARRLLSLGASMGLVETLLGPGIKRALAAPPRQALSRSPHLVMVVMDAFRADYMDLASMPNLHWLMSQGTAYTRAWVGQLESYTPSSHATLSTGATPAHQGVIGFEWRDPQTGQEDYTGWYDDVIAGRLEAQLQQHGVNSIPLALKRSDPDARIVALSSEKYYAADALGGPAADFILYGHVEGNAIVTRGIPHHVPPDSFMNLPSLTRPWPLTFGQYDEMAMTMALESLRALDPRALLINLPGPDVYGHRFGGPARQDVMKKLAAGCDEQLGRLIQALRGRGILDQTVFVVTGDHGMVENTHEVDTAFLKARIKEVGDYLFHVGGNSAFVWLRNPTPAVKQRVAQHLVNTVPHAPFAFYQTVESGKYVYHPVATAGTSIEPHLEAAYSYMLGTMAGPIAPDVALVFDENTITRTNPHPANPPTHGEHGGATWGTQHVPLVIAGPGVRKGFVSPFPARLMDVAPTVLTLLGIEPTNMDGVTLADAIQRPSNTAVHAQDSIADRLLAYQRAIISRSRIDLLAQNPPHVTLPGA